MPEGLGQKGSAKYFSQEVMLRQVPCSPREQGAGRTRLEHQQTYTRNAVRAGVVQDAGIANVTVPWGK